MSPRYWLPFLLCTILFFSCRKRPYKHLTDSLRGPKKQKKIEALKALEKLGPKAFTAIAEVSESMEDSSVRRQAANVLIAIGPRSVPALRKKLSSSSWKTREAAADALGALKSASKSATKELLKLLKSKKIYERIAAARALGAIGLTSDALRQVSFLLQDDEPSVRRTAAKVMGKAGARAKPYLLELRTAAIDKDYRTREYAVASIQKIGPPALTAMLQLLKADERGKSDVHMKLKVTQAIGSMGKPAERTIPTLIKMLDFQSDHAASMTVGGLASNRSVREAAAAALLTLAHPQVKHRKILKNALKKAAIQNESKQVQLIAAEALRKLK